jgi:hypothetical protein
LMRDNQLSHFNNYWVGLPAGAESTRPVPEPSL